MNSMGFLVFTGEDGDDLLSWIEWMETFSVRENFTSDETLNLAQCCIEGKARVWFSRRLSLLLFEDWNELRKELWWRFGNKNVIDGTRRREEARRTTKSMQRDKIQAVETSEAWPASPVVQEQFQHVKVIGNQAAHQVFDDIRLQEHIQKSPFTQSQVPHLSQEPCPSVNMLGNGLGLGELGDTKDLSQNGTRQKVLGGATKVIVNHAHQVFDKIPLKKQREPVDVQTPKIGYLETVEDEIQDVAVLVVKAKPEASKTRETQPGKANELAFKVEVVKTVKVCFVFDVETHSYAHQLFEIIFPGDKRGKQLLKPLQFPKTWKFKFKTKGEKSNLSCDKFMVAEEPWEKADVPQKKSQMTEVLILSIEAKYNSQEDVAVMCLNTFFKGVDLSVTSHMGLHTSEAVEETYSCSSRLKSSAEKDQITTQPGSKEMFVYLPGSRDDDLIIEVQGSKGQLLSRVVVQLAAIFNYNIANDCLDLIHYFLFLIIMKSNHKAILSHQEKAADIVEEVAMVEGNEARETVLAVVNAKSLDKLSLSVKGTENEPSKACVGFGAEFPSAATSCLREENLRKALLFEKQFVAELPTELNYWQHEHFEMQDTSETTLAETNDVITGIKAYSVEMGIKRTNAKEKSQKEDDILLSIFGVQILDVYYLHEEKYKWQEHVLVYEAPTEFDMKNEILTSGIRDKAIKKLNENLMSTNEYKEITVFHEEGIKIALVIGFQSMEKWVFYDDAIELRAVCFYIRSLAFFYGSLPRPPEYNHLEFRNKLQYNEHYINNECDSDSASSSGPWWLEAFKMADDLESKAKPLTYALVETYTEIEHDSMIKRVLDQFGDIEDKDELAQMGFFSVGCQVLHGQSRDGGFIENDIVAHSSRLGTLLEFLYGSSPRPPEDFLYL